MRLSFLFYNDSLVRLARLLVSRLVWCREYGRLARGLLSCAASNASFVANSRKTGSAPLRNVAAKKRTAVFVEYWHSLAILSGMAVFLFCVCALRFRKKIG